MSPVKLKHFHFRHGAYWYVRREGGKVRWTRLGRDMVRPIR